ncbi:hypothetical protein GmHk_10G028974 [Glycine max]|nr:hypothetical protein GmHk_10G028974 [Glycine max]
MCITLRLPRHVVLLDEGPGDRRSDYFTGGDGNSDGLAEAHDQRRKPQGPVRLIRVQSVPGGWHTCKQIDDVNNHLGHVDAHPCQDGIHQLTLRQREIGVMIARQDIAEQQCHPRMGQSGHAGAHDPHPPPYSGSGEILPRCA